MMDGHKDLEARRTAWAARRLAAHRRRADALASRANLGMYRLIAAVRSGPRHGRTATPKRALRPASRRES